MTTDLYIYGCTQTQKDMDTPKHTRTHGTTHTHTHKGNLCPILFVTLPKFVQGMKLHCSYRGSFVIGPWQQCGERIVFHSTLILGCRCRTVYSVSADLEYIVKSILIRLELDATLAIFWLRCTPESQNRVY